jgi:hypothetical protein
MFEAGRVALDQHRLNEALAQFRSIKTGVLTQAAKIVSARGAASIEVP